MTYLLIPGRHLILSKFQENLLQDILSTPLADLIEGVNSNNFEPFTELIFAITSANQDNSRYNPISLTHRLLGLDRFCKSIQEKNTISYSFAPIPHYPPSQKFASHIISEIEHSLELEINPQNTVVLCSTKAVYDLFKQLGFSIIYAEFDPRNNKYISLTPQQIITKIVSFDDWKTSEDVSLLLSDATLSTWKDFPLISKKLFRIWNDPLLTESGSLTQTRNYSSYAFGMGNDVIITQKYNEMKPFIKEGKIVDEGCADGILFTFIAKDFPDSDLLGIEITSEFYARCKERQRAGEYGETYVYFYQKNILENLFENNSIDTTICNSTTHELWSYGNKEESLRGYLEKKYLQSRKDGRLLIRDVVGPENKEQIIYLECNTVDGAGEVVPLNHPHLLDELKKQSTYVRFLQFAQDYLADMRHTERRGDETKISFEEVELHGKKLFKLSLKDACEFISKKDYVQNWKSELNEEFAFWSFSEWKIELEKAGFQTCDSGDKKSYAYTNEWIVENRYRGKVALYAFEDNNLIPLEFPVTNMVLVGEKK